MMIGHTNSMTIAYRNLAATNKAIEKTARALSTGSRIASSADDAAGFAVAQNLSAQVSGTERAIRNSQDGISMLQTAEVALNQINSMLQRMRELSIQAANDTLTTQDRGYIQKEIGELRKNIDSVAGNTTFNTKRLLDGSSAAIWSSDNANTTVKVEGVLNTLDQFGQKNSAEGNYRIEIKATAGKGQVQKSAIFTIPPKEFDGDSENDYQYVINLNDGVDETGKSSGMGWKFDNGVLKITGTGRYSITGNGTVTRNRVVVSEGANAQIRLTDVNISATEGSAFEISGADVKLFLKGENTLRAGSRERAGLEVNNIKDGRTGSIEINSTKGTGSEEGKLTATGSGCGAGIGGPCHTPSDGRTGNSVGAITINSGTIVANASIAGAAIGGGGYYADHPGDEAHVNITINGGNITATASGTGAGIGSGSVAPRDDTNVDKITINGGIIKATGGRGAAAIGGGAGANSGEIKISHYADLTLSGWIDSADGSTQSIGRGEGGASTNKKYNDVEFIDNREVVTLQQIPQFYNASNVFMVSDPQTIKITQGNGKEASITLYKTDTLEDVRNKLNDAIANDLGQAAYADNGSNFVSFVYEGEERDGFEAVAGTFVIRSAVAGNAGKLTFSSDNQDLLSILGLNTIQEARENSFRASIYDAHTGKTLVENIDTGGNSIDGIISSNVSVEFDSMANVKASWDDKTRRYILDSESKVYTTTVHIANRGTAFQIGQNIGEDVYVNIGDMRAKALGLDAVDVSTRQRASESITLLDRAIRKVSIQRTKVGTYQNELEHAASNMTQTNLHLQESESRLKDTDMATAAMEFIKLQILNNTGSTMMAQANLNSNAIMNILMR